MRVLRDILKELVQIRELLQNLPKEIPASAVTYLGSNQAKRPLQEFFTWNHRWVAMLHERNFITASKTYDLIESDFGDALFHLDQFAALGEFKKEIKPRGHYVLDFGVYKGSSTRSLAMLFPDHEIHGFDSFEGLPSRWSHALTGDVGDVTGKLPDVPKNVVLYPGWFSESIPDWMKQHETSPAALYRIDCDIYESAKDIYSSLGGKLMSGDVLLFDEFIGHRGFEQHDYKALWEFCNEKEFQVEYLAYGLSYVLLRLR